MKNNRKYSDYDSSEEQDDVQINYFQQPRNLHAYKSVEHFKKDMKAKNIEDAEDEPILQPKLSSQVQSPKIMPNNSMVSQTSQYVNKRPLTAAYTFKLKTPVKGKKKMDPVSLFQQTSQAWKRDKFLTSRGNNKQGRKLDLDKRNKETKA